VLGLDLMAEACAAVSDNQKDNQAVAPPPEILEMVRRIDGLRPSMAAPGNWALMFYADLRERLKSEPASRLGALGREIADSMKARLASHAGRMAGAAGTVLRDAERAITLSYSSSVEEALKTAAPEGCEIIVAESRPLLEGRRTVEQLREAGREARCVTDAEVGLFMREADALLIGADTICRDTAAVNKVGSLPAALAARRFGKPCAVVADTFKISGRLTAADVVLERGPGEEVWPGSGDICENVIFETVPGDLITCYVTEKGIIAHHQIREEAERWRRLWEGAGVEGE
jgi:translation initiation factor 2B subunit (eIF-2B alpha/beta/delta family)